MMRRFLIAIIVAAIACVGVAIAGDDVIFPGTPTGCHSCSCYDCKASNSTTDPACFAGGTCPDSGGACTCPEGFSNYACAQISCLRDYRGKNWPPFVLHKPDRLETDYHLCQCADGYQGHLCNVCIPKGNQTGTCLTNSDDTAGRCDSTAFTQKRKSFSCEVKNSDAIPLQEQAGASVTMTTYFDGSLAPTDNVVHFQFWSRWKTDDGTQQPGLHLLFACNATGCQQSVDSTGSVSYTCAESGCLAFCDTRTLSCSNLLSALLTQVGTDPTAKGITVKCSRDGTTCEIHEKAIDDMWGGIILGCTAGECVVGDVPPPGPDPTPPPPKSRDFPGAIVGLVCVGVVYVSLFVGMHFYVRSTKAGYRSLMEDSGAGSAGKKKRVDGRHLYEQVSSHDSLADLDRAQSPVPTTGAAGAADGWRGGSTDSTGTAGATVDAYFGGARAYELGHVPSTITFKDMTYIVKDKVLLRGVSGIVNPGALFAVMGPSGAGKSTILDILSLRNKRGKVSGEILVNGNAPQSQFRRLVGFVDQEDTLMGTLTVRESLTFSAMLRLPASVSLVDKARRVESVMSELKIDRIADSRIGTTLARGISGGEKRRVSIAMELVTAPSVLFLDEPTSGLDSYNAHVVIKCLKEMAVQTGTAVALSVHQPRSHIFHMFDTLMLLSQGRTLYHGPSDRAVEYFSMLGYRCTHDANPADFVIDLAVSPDKLPLESSLGVQCELASLDPEDNESEDPLAASVCRRQRIESLADHFAGSPLNQSLMSTIEEYTNKRDLHSVNDWRRRSKHAPGFLRQFALLSSRMVLNLQRNPFLLFGHLITSVLMGVIVGVLYFQIPMNDLEAIQNRMGALLIMCAFLAFGSLSSLELFWAERAIYVHERANRFYWPSSYFVSKVGFDFVPLRVFPPILMGAIAYYMMGLRSDGNHFLIYLAILVLINVTASSVCLIVGVLVDRMATGNLVASLFMLASLMLTNIFNNPKSMASYVAWLPYVSFFNYGYEALCINELKGVLFINIAFEGAQTNVMGDVILDKLGFSVSSLKRDILVLTAYCSGCLIIAYVCLKIFVRQTK